MKWRTLSHSFSDIMIYLSRLIASGTDKANEMRVVYTINDSNIIYVLSIFDFIDLKLQADMIKSISLCQMIKI